MAQVLLKHVSKHFDKTPIVPDLSLSVADQEFLVLVGPSGCGKSTVLRMIAGLEGVTAGEVWIDGRAVNQVAPKDRDIAMVFQNYALYPHMNVWDNMAFGLKMRKTPKAIITQRVEEAAKILDLQVLLKRKPKQLSGGQRQRVALGRAIVRDPKVFLMDEPLSNLDAKLRVQMRAEIIRLHRRLKATTIYVTHDQVEAMTMGDRIAVLNQGVLQQLDTPLTIYQRPANRFVASFMGQINFISSQKTGDRYFLTPPAGEPILLQESDCPRVSPSTGSLILGFRPEHGSIFQGENSADSLRLTVIPTLYETLGSETWVHADWQGQTLLFRVPADAILGALNEPLPIAIDLSRACWFDADTGLAV